MKGFRKLAYNSFPSSHEDIELELQRAGQPHCSSLMSEKGPGAKTRHHAFNGNSASNG